MASASITLEVCPGPILQSLLDVADVTRDLIAIIPDSHKAQRLDLQVRLERIASNLSIEVRKKDQPNATDV